MSVNMDFDYGTRKLAHYNQWLMDPNRKLGTIYPGFPEDLARERGLELLKADVAKRNEAKVAKQAAKAASKGAVKAKRVSRRAGGRTKLDQAVEIFRERSGDKAAVIADIQSKLGMSLAGATTYFYNAKKLAV